MGSSAIFAGCAIGLILADASVAPPLLKTFHLTKTTRDIFGFHHHYEFGADERSQSILEAENATDGRTTEVLWRFSDDGPGQYMMQPFFGSLVCWVFDLPRAAGWWESVLVMIFEMPASFLQDAAVGPPSRAQGEDCTEFRTSQAKAGGWVYNFSYCITADGRVLEGNTSNIRDGKVQWASTLEFFGYETAVDPAKIAPPASGCVNLTTRGVVPADIAAVNAPEWIASLNLLTGGLWKAGANAAFDGVHWAAARSKLGAQMRANRLDLLPRPAPSSLALAQEFDARAAWPRCPSISEIRNQGDCGCCWAFGAVEVLADRLCIAGQAPNLTLSAQHLVLCDSSNDGCSGGFLDNAWRFLSQSGVVTEACDPYQHCKDPSRPSCEPGAAKLSVEECPSSCVDGSQLRHFRASVVYAVSKPGDAVAMQQEIAASGPVEAAFFVFQDFMSYQSGVYFRTAASGASQGGHAIRILGWGMDKDEPYWLVANSWGPGWGEAGFFRIRRGVNECGIESIPAAGSAPEASAGALELHLV